MPISSEDKLRLLSNAVSEMALIGYRLDKLLVGFKLYHEHKGTTDLDTYQSVLQMYEDAIEAMAEQMRHYHRLFTYIQAMVEEGE